MNDNHYFGMALFTATLRRAQYRLISLPINEYERLCASALGPGLSIPNDHECQLSRTLFVDTVLISVKAEKWQQDILALSRNSSGARIHGISELS